MNRTNEAAFETVIEAHLLQNGYARVAHEGFDRERAIFSEIVLAFIRETQPKEWAKLEALHGDKTGEQILTEGRAQSADNATSQVFQPTPPSRCTSISRRCAISWAVSPCSFAKKGERSGNGERTTARRFARWRFSSER